MTFWRFIAGAEAGLLLILAWVLWRVLAMVVAQRRQIADLAVTLRLYRETRTDSDRQIRELLSQNERLARHLIDRAVDLQVAPVSTVEQWRALARPLRES